MLNYAVRDTVDETYIQWWWRHFKGLMTTGLVRPKPKMLLPICKSCVNELVSCLTGEDK